MSTDETLLTDSVDGTDKAPIRYTQDGRETIDKMRDSAYDEAVKLLAVNDLIYGPELDYDATIKLLGDALFTFHCTATAMKYEDRQGHKGDPEDDAKKARFYRQMAAHVRGKGEDPRKERPDFKPYERLRVHVLWYGVVLCGAHMGLVPKEWPAGHRWLSPEEARKSIGQITCGGCALRACFPLPGETGFSKE